jgi:hypothetical protein
MGYPEIVRLSVSFSSTWLVGLQNDLMRASRDHTHFKFESPSWNITANNLVSIGDVLVFSSWTASVFNHRDIKRRARHTERGSSARNIRRAQQLASAFDCLTVR